MAKCSCNENADACEKSTETGRSIVYYRVGPDSPFALLSPVLGSKIPFEKGFLESPFSPSINTTFCPVLGLHGPFAEPSISFIHVFHKILVQISTTISIRWNFWRYAPFFSPLDLVDQFYVLLASIFKRNLVRRTSGMAQTSFGSGFIAKSSIIFRGGFLKEEVTWSQNHKLAVPTFTSML